MYILFLVICNTQKRFIEYVITNYSGIHILINNIEKKKREKSREKREKKREKKERKR
jgi:hypothetical protein